MSQTESSNESPFGKEPFENEPEQRNAFINRIIKIFDEAALIRSQNQEGLLNGNEPQSNTEKVKERQKQFGLSPKDKYYFQL